MTSWKDRILWILLFLLVLLPAIIGGIKSKPNTTNPKKAFYSPACAEYKENKEREK